MISPTFAAYRNPNEPATEAQKWRTRSEQRKIPNPNIRLLTNSDVKTDQLKAQKLLDKSLTLSLLEKEKPSPRYLRDSLRRSVRWPNKTKVVRLAVKLNFYYGSFLIRQGAAD